MVYATSLWPRAGVGDRTACFSPTPTFPLPRSRLTLYLSGRTRFPFAARSAARAPFACLFLSPTFALATSAICSPRRHPSAFCAAVKRGPHPLLASSAPESTFPLRPSRSIAPQRPLTTTFLTNLRCPFYLELRRPRSESRGASPELCETCSELRGARSQFLLRRRARRFARPGSPGGAAELCVSMPRAWRACGERRAPLLGGLRVEWCEVTGVTGREPRGTGVWSTRLHCGHAPGVGPRCPYAPGCFVTLSSTATSD